jgi:hypothetical protein
MLGTIGQFAREQLQASGEESNIAGRHARHYAAFAEEAEPGLTGPEQGATIRRLELDYQNLHGALRYATEHDDGETALRVAGALWRFWLGTGRVAEGLEALQTALAGGKSCPPLVRARALSAGGNLAFQRGNLDLAAQLHGEALDLRRGAGDTRGTAGTLNNLASSRGSAATSREPNSSMRRASRPTEMSTIPMAWHWS